MAGSEKTFVSTSASQRISAGDKPREHRHFESRPLDDRNAPQFDDQTSRLALLRSIEPCQKVFNTVDRPRFCAFRFLANRVEMMHYYCRGE